MSKTPLEKAIEAILPLKREDAPEKDPRWFEMNELWRLSNQAWLESKAAKDRMLLAEYRTERLFRHINLRKEILKIELGIEDNESNCHE